MHGRSPLAILVWMCLLVGWTEHVTSATPEGLSMFVEDAAAQLASSPLQITRFQSAKMHAIEELAGPAGFTQYLCWLCKDQTRVGYMAIAQSANAYEILAFSSSTMPPQYFLKYLQATTPAQKTPHWGSAQQESFVTDMPLVATAQTFLGNTPVEISELAASLSSVLNFVQSQERVLLFEHVGATADPEYTRRFTEDPNSANEPADPSWRSAAEEVKAALAGDTYPYGRSLEEQGVFLGRQYSIAKPIIRRRLLDPVNARERFDVLCLERTVVATRIDISSGMKDAVGLQMSYLNMTDPNLTRDLDLFFRTRGRVASVKTQPFGSLASDSAPALLMGPDNISGVLLGYVDVTGERFACVFFPRTSAPTRMSLTEHMAKSREEKGLPREDPVAEEERLKESIEKAEASERALRKLYQDKGLPDPLPKESVEQRLREGMARVKASHDKMQVVEDKRSTSLQGMENELKENELKVSGTFSGV